MNYSYEMLMDSSTALKNTLNRTKGDILNFIFCGIFISKTGDEEFGSKINARANVAISKSCLDNYKK